MPEEPTDNSPQPATTTSKNKKPVLVILIIGIAIGILLSLAFWYLKSVYSPTNQEKAAQTKPTQLLLSLSSPEDGSTVSEDTVTVSGTTGVAAIVIINGGAKDVILDRTDGQFSTEYKLIEGENELIITAFDEVGNELSETRSVLYLNEQLD